MMQYKYNSFWPVSNLMYVSKLIERLAYSQLMTYLQSYNLLFPVQSANRRYHSTETATRKVALDVYDAADVGRVTILVLLNYYFGSSWPQRCLRYCWPQHTAAETECHIWHRRDSSAVDGVFSHWSVRRYLLCWPAVYAINSDLRCPPGICSWAAAV